MKKQTKSNLMLLLTSFIWGSAFIAQSKGADVLGPFTFNTFRYALAVIALLPVIKFMSLGNISAEADKKESSYIFGMSKTLIAGGFSTGILLYISSGLQQYAMAYTTAAKAGFITTLYVILVPVCGVLLRKKIRPIIWICAIIALAGLYLLAITPGTFSISRGDFFVLLCALGFTGHILVIDYFSPKVDGVKMSCIQFAVVSVLSCITMLATESISASDIIQALFPIAYAGILSSAVAYTLQIIAQKDADPSVASLILSLESVFSAICGFIFLHQILSLREIAGCALVFVAIIIAQLPSKSTPNNDN